MSGELLCDAWASGYPAKTKMVLMVLGDNANGEDWCVLDTRYIAARSGLSEQDLQTSLSALEADGAVRKVAYPPGHSRPGICYALFPSNFKKARL